MKGCAHPQDVFFRVEILSTKNTPGEYPGRDTRKEWLSSSFIRTIPSVPESHRFMPFGSRTVTAGGESHPALKNRLQLRGSAETVGWLFSGI